MKADVIKPEGKRWFLDMDAHRAAQRGAWRKVALVTGLLTAGAAAIAALA